MARLETVQLPDFGMSEETPVLPASLYERRLQAAVERMKQARLTFLVVYADREHSANMSFLTGFDPRFEEAVLLLDTVGKHENGGTTSGALSPAGLRIAERPLDSRHRNRVLKCR